jgi:hypothetical protein
MDLQRSTMQGWNNIIPLAGQAQVGNALLGATDPTTGQIDTNKLTQNLAQTPIGRMNLPQALQQAQTIQIQKQALQQQQLSTAKSQNDRLLGYLLPLQQQLQANNGIPNADFDKQVLNTLADARNDPEYLADVKAWSTVRYPISTS